MNYNHSATEVRPTNTHTHTRLTAQVRPTKPNAKLALKTTN